MPTARHFRGNSIGLRLALAFLALALLAGAPASAQTGPNAFTFVAFGDMPYRDADIEKVDRLIGAINRLKPAFTIHVGDIKSGAAPCTDGDLERAIEQVNTLEQPVRDTAMRPVPNTLRLQVPGDNLVHAVRILVDPDMPGVFGFVPLIVPENGPF